MYDLCIELISSSDCIMQILNQYGSISANSMFKDSLFTARAKVAWVLKNCLKNPHCSIFDERYSFGVTFVKSGAWKLTCSIALLSPVLP